MSSLPSGWVQTEMGRVADIKLGKMLDAAKNKGDPIQYLRNVNVRWGSFDLSDLLEMRMTTDELQTYSIRDGDILICEGGEPGRSAVWQSGLTKLKFQKALHRARPYDGISPAFLAHYLKHLSVTGEIERKFTGTTIKHLPLANIKELPLTLAPSSEQQRIVTKIDALSAKSRRARDQLDHIRRLVVKYKQAILASAFRGDLTSYWRLKNLTDTWSKQQLDRLEKCRNVYLTQRRGSRLGLSLGEFKALPNGWFPAILADVGSLQVGYAYKSKWFSKEGVRLLRGANIAPGAVIWDDEVRLPPKLAADYSEYVLNVGDIVIAMDRPVISTGLKVARISQTDAGALLVQRVARYVHSAFVDGGFVWHFMTSQFFIDHAVSQSTGSDLPHISSNDILTTPLPLPPLQEQREIVRRVEAALAWIDRVASEATSARKLIDYLDQAVLAKAFHGELVPQDPTDEPASILLERIKLERQQSKQPMLREIKRRKAKY